MRKMYNKLEMPWDSELYSGTVFKKIEANTEI